MTARSFWETLPAGAELLPETARPVSVGARP